MRAALLFLLLIPCWVIAFKYHVDLKVLHAVAEMISTNVLHVYDGGISIGRFFYGPVTLLLIWPLSFFSYGAAELVWVIVQTVAYVFFWVWMFRFFPVTLRGKIGFFLLAWCFALNPIHNNFQSGNIQLILLALLAWAEGWSADCPKINRFIAGLLVSLVSVVKVFPAFLIPYYVVRRDKWLIGGIAVGLVFAFLAPAVVFGWDSNVLLHQGFLSNLTTYGKDNPLVEIPDILSLASLFARVGLPSLFFPIAFVVISVFFYVWMAKHRVVGSGSWSLALALMALLNPSTRVHYFIFYVPAFLAVLEFSFAQNRRKLQWGIYAVFALIALTMQGVVGKKLNDILEFQNFPTWGAILLCGLVWISLRFFIESSPHRS